VKKLKWRKRRTIAENVAARVEANRIKGQRESDALRARLSVLSPDREKAAQRTN
jgi:hypothetical protein